MNGSHGMWGNDQRRTYRRMLEEFSVPYQLFHEAGYQVTIASLGGVAIPVDPRSTTESTLRGNSEDALRLLNDSVPLSEVDTAAFDAVFFPGGHGTMFDLPSSKVVAGTVKAFVGSDRPAAFVCHGPAALVGVTGADGDPLVKGRKLTAFTDSEEHAVQLQDAVPFLLASKLEELGATLIQAPDFEAHVVVDKNLITGQNPASSLKAAQALLLQLSTVSDKRLTPQIRPVRRSCENVRNRLGRVTPYSERAAGRRRSRS